MQQLANELKNSFIKILDKAKSKKVKCLNSERDILSKKSIGIGKKCYLAAQKLCKKGRLVA